MNDLDIENIEIGDHAIERFRLRFTNAASNRQEHYHRIYIKENLRKLSTKESTEDFIRECLILCRKVKMDRKTKKREIRHARMSHDGNMGRRFRLGCLDFIIVKNNGQEYLTTVEVIEDRRLNYSRRIIP